MEIKMTRIIGILFSLLLFTGCANEGKFISSGLPNTCGSNGHTFVFIKYGDSHIAAKSVIRVRPGRELQYRLVPDRVPALIDYEDAVVTISGKTAPVPPFPSPPADDAWLDASGSYNSSGGVMKVCVPTNPVGAQYYYTIEVAGVGELDPRADIEH